MKQIHGGENIVVLILFLISAVFFDFLYEKIPNFMIVAGLILGILYRIGIKGDKRIPVLLMEKCSFIYTIAPNDGLAMAKVEQYEKILEELHYKDILNRTRKVTPPVFRKLPIRPEELIHSELAEYTRKITEDEFHWSKA